MPKIRSTSLHLATKMVEVNVYYIPSKDTRWGGSPFFFVTPVDKELLLPNSPLLVGVRVGSNHYTGVTGKTEEEALQAFKDYLKVYEEQNLTKVPLLFIKIDDANKAERKPTDVAVNFEYMVGYKMTLQGKEFYYQDAVYHGLRKDPEVYKATERWTIVPFSPEALERCELVVQQFARLNQQMQELFQSSEKALETLASNIHLLTNTDA